MTVQENSNFSRENRLGGYYRERKSASLVKQIEKNLETNTHKPSSDSGRSSPKIFVALSAILKKRVCMNESM